jgi:caa(3)-type oxidase subunit IV
MSGHISPKSTYITIFGALMVCTILTVLAAFINLGDLNFPVAITIRGLQGDLSSCCSSCT